MEKRRLAEEINAAGIEGMLLSTIWLTFLNFNLFLDLSSDWFGYEGLESCPFCDYCEVPNENTSLFQCKFPDCLQISCRQCRELNHLPLRCEEFVMKQRLNNYVETKMTEALLRQCPSCKKSIVKSDGCNKVVGYLYFESHLKLSFMCFFYFFFFNRFACVVLLSATSVANKSKITATLQTIVILKINLKTTFPKNVLFFLTPISCTRRKWLRVPKMLEPN